MGLRSSTVFMARRAPNASAAPTDHPLSVCEGCSMAFEDFCLRDVDMPSSMDLAPHSRQYLSLFSPVQSGFSFPSHRKDGMII